MVDVFMLKHSDAMSKSFNLIYPLVRFFSALLILLLSERVIVRNRPNTVDYGYTGNLGGTLGTQAVICEKGKTSKVRFKGTDMCYLVL